jgi:hypothetical protein
MEDDPMTTFEKWYLFTNAVVAAGTILLAGVAIYGERLRLWLIGPKLTLEIVEKGATFANLPRVYRFLKILNGRPSAVATNCRVQVSKVWRRLPSGGFEEMPLAYPLILSWPPSEYTGLTESVKKEQRVDFGYVEQNSGFKPNVRFFPNNFNDIAVVRSGNTMRYSVEIISDQYASPKPQVFEVSWNGEWSESVDQMANHLTIHEV